MKFYVEYTKVNGDLFSTEIDGNIEIAFPHKVIGETLNEDGELLADRVVDLNLNTVNFNQKESDYASLMPGVDKLFYNLEANATDFKVAVISEVSQNKTVIFSCSKILKADYSINLNDFATTGLIEGFLAIEYEK